MPFEARDDVPAREVAERWLNGETAVTIATDYACSAFTINRRIATARELHPDLPWHLRDQPFGSSVGYVRMNDGKKGQTTGRGQAVRQGRHRPGH